MLIGKVLYTLRAISRKKLSTSMSSSSIHLSPYLNLTSFHSLSRLTSTHQPSSLIHISPIPSPPPPQPQTKKSLQQPSPSLVVFQPAVPSPKREKQRREIYTNPSRPPKTPTPEPGKASLKCLQLTSASSVVEKARTV